MNGSEQVLPTLSLKLPACLTCRVKAPSGPEVTGRFAGSAGVVRAETVAPGRSMLDVSPGAEAVMVPVTVVVKLVGVVVPVPPPPPGLVVPSPPPAVPVPPPPGEGQAESSRDAANTAESSAANFDRRLNVP